eukprot:143291-Chlamydomonas_euryale.AAC.1
MVRERNWLNVYPYTNWGGRELPVFEQGQVFQPAELALKRGATMPPPRLTERDLLAKMEAYGIGTDATIAQHIQNQLDRCAHARAKTRDRPGGRGRVDGAGWTGP